MICSPSPHATVRQRMCLRSVEKRYAARSTARIPSTPVNRPKRLLLCGRRNAQNDFRLPYSIPQIAFSIFSREHAPNQWHCVRADSGEPDRLFQGSPLARPATPAESRKSSPTAALSQPSLRAAHGTEFPRADRPALQPSRAPRQCAALPSPAPSYPSRQHSRSPTPQQSPSRPACESLRDRRRLERLRLAPRSFPETPPAQIHRSAPLPPANSRSSGESALPPR